MILSQWNFSIDNAQKQNEFILHGVKGEAVTVPHTWNIQPEYETYSGVAWYSTALYIDKIKDVNILHFEAVFHTAEVFVNGISVCKHSCSGYTPFEADITKCLKTGENIITVKCDSSFSENMLPHKADYDWANDGGIIREVTFEQKDYFSVKTCRIKTEILKYYDNGRCDAAVSADIELYDAVQNELAIEIKNGNGETVYQLNDTVKDGIYKLVADIKNIELWDTQNPEMYILSVNDEKYKFGVREIRVDGDKIILNGKETKLIGVEWMPGSDPDYGTAETKEISYKFLQQLKDLNCNFTRFHWQQADYIYDWCDEHGLMVQEEIPYWGSPKSSTEKQVGIAKQQADEMYAAHCNHPSIVCWGVGNELNGRSQKTIKYVKELVSYFKSFDKTRLVNYVSNTMGNFASKFLFFNLKLLPDATVFGDICMWNEYMGTWYRTTEYEKMMKYVCNQAKDKPFMVTEFGLCEPHFDGGDERRISIYKEKIKLYNDFNLNGWVYFSLNDYRTHCGEIGDGRFKRRVHGSTDLKGVIKPSFEYIKKQNKIDLGL